MKAALIAQLTHSVPSVRLAATGYHFPSLPWVQGCCPTIQPGREMERERQETPELCSSWIQWQQGHLFQPINFVFVKLKLQIVFREDIYAAFRASVVQVFRGTLPAGWGGGMGTDLRTERATVTHRCLHPERNHILLQWAGLPGTKYNPAARLTLSRDAAELT